MKLSRVLDCIIVVHKQLDRDHNYPDYRSERYEDFRVLYASRLVGFSSMIVSVVTLLPGIALTTLVSEWDTPLWMHLIFWAAISLTIVGGRVYRRKLEQYEIKYDIVEKGQW